MTRNEYKSDIRSRIGKLKEEYTLRDTELNLRIKQARIFIAERLWMFCKERLKHSNTYSLAGPVSKAIEYQDLPSDFIKDTAMTIGAEPATKIDFSDYIAITKNYYFTPSTTNPIYCIRKDQVGMSPVTVGTSCILYYIAKPTAFSDDTSDENTLELNIPAEFQGLVVQKVCEELSSRSDIDYKPVTTVQGEIDRLMGKKREDITNDT